MERCDSCGRKRCAQRVLCRKAHEAGTEASNAALALGKDWLRGHLYPEVRAKMVAAAEAFRALGTKEGQAAANAWLFRAGAR